MVIFLSSPIIVAVLFSWIVTVLLSPVNTRSISASSPAAVAATFTVVALLLPVIVCMILLSAEAEFAPTETVDVLELPACLSVKVCVAPTTVAVIVFVLPIWSISKV